MKYIFLLFVVFFISGCATNQVSKDASFNEASTKALVIIGLSTNAYGSYELTVGKYDTTKKRIDSSYADNGTTVFFEGAPEVEFYLLSLDPGVYVFRKIRRNATPEKTEVCLNKGTFAFEVKKGKSYYLGDLSYNIKTGVSLSNGSIEQAYAVLKAYPNIKTIIETVKLTPAIFEHDLSALGGFNGCGTYF